MEEKKGKGGLIFFLGTLAGAVVGIASWILFVPKQTKEKADEIGDEVKERTKEIAAEVKEKAIDLKENLEELEDVAKEKARNLKEKAVEFKDTAVYIGEGIGQVVAEYSKQGKEIVSDKVSRIATKAGKAYEAGKDAFIKRKEELKEEKKEGKED